MATNRFGYSDDFVLKNGKVGINTADPQETLDVAGVAKGENLKVTGVSSFTTYEGFLSSNQTVSESITLNENQGLTASLSGEIIVGTGQTVTVNAVTEESKFGPELITNTDFSDNTDNWTANGATLPTLSIDADRLKILHNGANGGAYQNITTVVGGTYIITAYLSNGTATGIRLRVYGDGASGDGFQGTVYTGTTISSTSSTLAEFVIDAETTTTRVYIEVLGSDTQYAFAHSIHAKRANDVEAVTNVTQSGQGVVDSLKVYNTFNPPVGGTNDRPIKAKPGQLYYNQDFKTIEFWDGNNWRQVDNTTRSGRGVFAGGVNGPGTAGTYSEIEYLNIQSLGNTQSFGDLNVNKYSGASMSSSTRGVFAGGWGTPVNNFDIEYITIASQGNAIDWTQNNSGGWGSMGASSSTRGLSAGGGFPAATTTIDSIQFSTIGSIEDWGDITAQRGRGTSGCNSPTRAIFFGGYNPVVTSTIEFKQTASNSNTIFFGDLLFDTNINGGSGNSVRGIICGGYGRTPSTLYKSIQYVTISSTGNAQYFGDLSVTIYGSAQLSDQVRSISAGGYNGSNFINSIEYVTIASSGNAQDFGDLSKPGYEQMGCSDSHGGLGGF